MEQDVRFEVCSFADECVGRSARHPCYDEPRQAAVLGSAVVPCCTREECEKLAAHKAKEEEARGK